MKAFRTPLHELGDVEEILGCLKKNRGVLQVTGCIDSQKSHFIDCLSEGYAHKVIVAANDLKAKEIYEKELQSDDPRLGGLYNNLGLTLTDLKRFDEAEEYYNKAINVMSDNKNGELEIAITYLNLCDLNEAKLGSEQSEKIIDEYIEKAYELLNRDYLPRNGYYAFVCEKCAPTFGYFGRFLYQKELSDRARCIYERN